MANEDEIQGRKLFSTRGFDDWTMDMKISNASLASFIGENDEDYSGMSVSGAGDVNGDGYNDILIGARRNDDGGSDAGQTYLIFGKVTGWSMDADLSKADASFIGEGAEDHSGCSVSGAGDVNGDGYDDILIGASQNDDGGSDAGQTYLIFGKLTGWSMNTDLSKADASFIGEDAEEYSGCSVSSAGDVNGDSYNDILIGAVGNEEGGGSYSGQSYLIFGKSTGWSMDLDLSKADASFIGEGVEDHSGCSVSGAGDVNSDGYDDILIGARRNDDGGSDAGQTYLVFGKLTGWSMNTDLSKADASFIGEGAVDLSGYSVSGAGDVNGDGYDDILIGAYSNGFEGPGQTYLILGKASGWTMDTTLSTSDASFIGENDFDASGWSVSSAGDVNGDGYDDILIGAPANDDGGSQAGQTYLILGKMAGWSMDTDLSTAGASFIGEEASDQSGYSVSGVGDVNGDWGDDILIGAYGNDDGRDESGQTYLIEGIGITDVVDVYSFEVYTEPFSNPGRTFDIGKSVFMELTGEDGNASNQDAAIINITFSSRILRIILRETGMNTGIYRGQFIIPVYISYLELVNLEPRADPSFAIDILIDYPFRPTSINSVSIFSDKGLTNAIDKIDFGDKAYFAVSGEDANPLLQDKAFLNLSSDKNISFNPLIICRETGINTGLYVWNITVNDSMVWFENITATSVRDPTKISVFQVHTPVQIRPSYDITSIYQDEEYRLRYWNFGYNEVIWNLNTNAEWLEFDEGSGYLHGIPFNGDVGTFWVYLNASDDLGNIDSRFFNIIVVNIQPVIVTEDLTEIYQGQYYEVDYNSDEDGQEDIKWTCDLGTADWLNFDEYTGILNGTPLQENIGFYSINISVDDGNGGLDKREFTLEVVDINIPPLITATPITSINQNVPYYTDFMVIDPDGDIINWNVHTNASFLSINNETGELFGTPSNDDIGIYFINVTAEDPGELKDWINYTLEVIDVNDDPSWINVPLDSNVDQGQIFSFQVEASDVDLDDMVTYHIEADPDIGIEIDPDTGLIEWNATIEGIAPNPDYTIQVTVYASDGEVEISHLFSLTVIPNPSPISKLLSPDDDELVTSKGIYLEWEGEDDSPDLLYDLYFSEIYNSILEFKEDALHQGDISGTTIWISDLTQGSTYYWTVIPKDQFSIGTCQEDIYSFRVNTLPHISEITNQTANIGDEFSLSISGSDSETSSDDLVFSLISAPEGMKIFGNQIFWTPGVNEVGIHTVEISLFDGLEYTNTSFEIMVTEKDIEPEDNGGGFPIWIILVILLIMILLIGVGIGAYTFFKKKELTEPEEPVSEEATPQDDTGLTEEGKQVFEQFFGPK